MKVYLALCEEYAETHILGLYRSRSNAARIAKLRERRITREYRKSLGLAPDWKSDHIDGYVREFEVR